MTAFLRKSITSTMITMVTHARAELQISMASANLSFIETYTTRDFKLSFVLVHTGITSDVYENFRVGRPITNYQHPWPSEFLR